MTIQITRRTTGQLFAAAFLLCATLATTACGGGAAGGNPPGNPGGNPGGSSNSAMQVKIGDAPADRVVSFELAVGAMSLTPSSGSAVTVLPGTSRLEVTHLSGTNEPLSLLDIPQASYTTLAMTVSNPEVTFVNSLGQLTKLQPHTSQAITVNFSPALSIGAAASVMNIDLNVSKSLTFDAQGNVTGIAITPSSFNISTAAIAAEDRQHAEDGELEDMNGVVTAVSGSTFTLAVGQNGVALVFDTDANTSFNDGATLATMLNTIVKVEGITHTDGTLYAKEVEGMENENGSELEGLVSSVIGNPATQLSVLSHDGVGQGVDDTVVGTTLSADVSGARYKVNAGNVDLSGLGGIPSTPNFPFDATTVHPGQHVELDSDRPVAAGAMVAEKVKLQQQALTGTVSGLAGPTSAGPVTFTLTLPADSAFAMLSGQLSVTAYWQPGTDLHGLSSIDNGDRVRVRGLVFYTGSSFNIIARRIDR